MKEIGNTLTHIAETTGAAVIFVHHHSKGNQGNKRSLERASGAGAWGRFPDSVLDITLQGERDKLFRMSFTLRDFEAPDDFLSRRIVPGPRWDRSEIRPEELDADIEAAKQSKKEEEAEDLCKKVADLVRNGEKVNNTEWEKRAKEALGIGRRKFELARDWLLENCIAQRADGPSGSSIYSFRNNIGERFERQD